VFENDSMVLSKWGCQSEILMLRKKSNIKKREKYSYYYNSVVPVPAPREVLLGTAPL